jgi:hypothetical protein
MLESERVRTVDIDFSFNKIVLEWKLVDELLLERCIGSRKVLLPPKIGG